VIPRLCDRVCDWFVESAVLAGKVQRNGKRTVDHSTPRWDYVNPAQDVKADVTAISNALLSPSEALRRRGYKPEQVFAEMGRDFKAMQSSGALDLMSFLQAKSTAPADTAKT
jgi:capsid protein